MPVLFRIFAEMLISPETLEGLELSKICKNIFF
jgi:hypothetical protein